MQNNNSVSASFWTHGLWPSYWWTPKKASAPLSACPGPNLTLADIADLMPALSYWMPNPSHPDFGPASNFDWWAHEWAMHGRCAGLTANAFFKVTMERAANINPAVAAALANRGIVPSNNVQYTVGQIADALSAAFGPGFSAASSLQCRTDSLGRINLHQVQVCLDRATMEPCNCYVRAGGVTMLGVSPATAFCGERSTKIWFNAFVTGASTFTAVPRPWLWMVVGSVTTLALAVLAAYLVLAQCGAIPPLFAPYQRPQVVHNPLVNQPVLVCVEALDMAKLHKEVPELAAIVDDLPRGMALKGGIARRILKILEGNPEPEGAYDVDVLLFLPEAARALLAVRRAALEEVSGLALGALTLEPQDCEVATKSHLLEYFLSRDVSLNEVVILKHPPCDERGKQLLKEQQKRTGSSADTLPHLYFTKDAQEDAAAGRVRPSVHMLRSDLQVVWGVDDNDGTPYIMPSVLSRVIIRLLKGHANDYALDPGSWRHYRSRKLDQITLFKILRPFHDDSAKLQAAVDHLVQVGFVSRIDVWKAGGVNMLWGLLLKEVNAAIAQYGGRMTLGSLDAEAVERWMDAKQMQVATKTLDAQLRGRRTGFVPSGEDTESLGLVSMPDSLYDYVRDAPTYDASEAIQHALADSGDAAQALLAAAGLAGARSSGSASWAGRRVGSREPSILAAQAPLGGEVLWVNLKDTGHYQDPQQPAQLGSFYQVWKDTDTEGMEPLINDADIKQKARVPASRLTTFLLSSMRPGVKYLVPAYLLLFTGSGCQLYMPLRQAAVFNALGAMNRGSLAYELSAYAFLTALDVSVNFAGLLLMELAAAAIMKPLHACLFEHMLGQTSVMLSGISPGELMSRTSGDASVMYSLVTTATFKVFDGFLLTMGSGVFLIRLFSMPYTGPHVFQGLVCIVIVISIVEAALMALGLRPLNLRLRQSMGRMFGFTLDVFSHASTVAGLGMASLLCDNYKDFASDNFTNFTLYNIVALVHRSFTYALASCMYIAALWIGAYQALAGYTTVGDLVAILRYMRVMRRGIKTTSDSCVRFTGSLGSLERLVQLHDRGVFVTSATSDGRPMECAHGATGPHGHDHERGGGGSGSALRAAWGGLVAAVARLLPGGGAATPDPLREPLRPGGEGGEAKDPAAPEWLSNVTLTHVMRHMHLPWDRCCATPEVPMHLAAALRGLRPAGMQGGVALRGVSLSLRSRVETVVLRELNLQVLAGEVLLITGPRGCGKSLLLEQLLLLHLPFRGELMLQYSGPDPSRAPSGGEGSTSSAGTSAPPPSWRWEPVRFLTDDLAGLRRRIGLASLATSGVFRVSLEDNVACAAAAAGIDTTLDDVRKVCASVGLHELAMSLPEGYRTIIGDGTGIQVAEHMALRLSLARALVRRPALLLVDDTDQLAQALPDGEATLVALLRAAAAAGTAVVVSAWKPGALAAALGARVQEMQEGTLLPASAPRSA